MPERDELFERKIASGILEAMDCGRFEVSADHFMIKTVHRNIDSLHCDRSFVAVFFVVATSYRIQEPISVIKSLYEIGKFRYNTITE